MTVEHGTHGNAHTKQRIFSKNIIPIANKSQFFREQNTRLVQAMTCLYRNIDNLLPDVECKVIQFVSSSSNKNCSILAREFAKVSALNLNKRVLVLDYDPNRKIHSDLFNVESMPLLEYIGERKNSLNCNIHRVLDTQLYFAQIDFNFLFHSLENPLASDFEMLKSDFDLILVNPPVSTVEKSNFVVSRKVNGFVLVVESGKTRWKVAEHLQRNILFMGGNVLGVFLNNRTFPIPRFIYKRL